jgi:hypothetical protein
MRPRYARYQWVPKDVIRLVSYHVLEVRCGGQSVRVVMHFAPTTLLKSVYGFHQLNDTVHAEQMMGVSWRASTN